MLFLTYAILAPGTRTLRLVALLLAVVTSVFKLVLWHDVRSWGIGILLGAALAGARAALPWWKVQTSEVRS